ncbi:MAG TPA: membrane protein insertion efficiency factor YidD [Porticoccaceae bacterium]|nr:membrane protein insertion efficiency factor YidD [Porticoccaceae bacterium]HCO59141.1 membrane protein insertion efficiency factor YidD [Porticoccaceae bacterium]
MITGLLTRVIKAYQYCVSPLLGRHCRFYPSCSQYAVDSLQRHGAVKGLFFTARRLGKCHPFHPGGYDPVPEPSATLKQVDK